MQEITRPITLPDDIAQSLGRLAHALDPRFAAEFNDEGVAWALDGPVNVYPGRRRGGCMETCYVLSLAPEARGAARGWVPFGDALRQLRDHADACACTRRLVLVTNEWHAAAAKDWLDTLDRLRREGREVYLVLLIGGRGFTPIAV